MKFNILKKVFIFISCSILCFLLNASLSGAEQPVSNLSKQIFSAEALKAIEGFDVEKGSTPPVQPAAASKDVPSVDIKIGLSEQFKAVLSLGDTGIRDLAGKNVGQSYSAVFGFQIILR